MRKLKRILTGVLAILLILSNLQLSSLTVSATEANDEIVEDVTDESVNDTSLDAQDEPLIVQNEDEGKEPPVVQNEDEGKEPPIVQNEDEGKEPPVVQNEDEGKEPPVIQNEDEGKEPPVVQNENEGKEPQVVEDSISEGEEGNANEVIYNFNQLIELKGYGYEKEIDEGGNISYSFTDQYGEAFYALPEGFDASKVCKVELLGEGVTLKLYPNADGTGNVTNDNGSYDDIEVNYSNTVSPTYQFNSFGIMNNSEDMAATLSGVKFTLGDTLLAERTYEDEEATEEPVGNEYKMSSLKLVDTADVVVVKKEDGSAELTFKGNWKTLFMEIPDALSGLNIDKVTFNVTSDNAASFGYKTFTAEQYEKDKWGSSTDLSYGNPAVATAAGTKADLKYLAITSNFAQEQDDTEITMTISGVSFETSEVTEEDNTPVMDITYNFVDLVDLGTGWGYTKEVSQGGEISLDFSGQYAEMKIAVPSELDASKIMNVKVNVTSGSESGMAIKQYDADAKEQKVEYGRLEMAPAGDFASIGIMAKDEACSIKLSGITFSYKGEAEITKTYTFNELAESKNGGVTKNVDSATGAATFVFGSNYQEVFFEFPKEIDSSKIHKVTFNTSSENVGVTAYKFYTEDEYAGSDWPSTERVSYGNPVVVETADNKVVFNGTEYFGIMSCGSADTNWGDYSFTFDSVTFHTTGWGYAEESKEEITYGDNIISNPYFEAAGDLSVWQSAQGNSVITAEVSDSAIGDTGITTYGKIDRNPETSSTGDSFVQDITEKVNKNEEYQVEFWAMLSEDYAGADAEQRVVEFAPYIVEGGETQYLGATYSSQISGNLSQTLEPGVWTKYSGTFKIAGESGGNVEQVVIRIIEQGTEYGSGECVLGDYYVTAVSMQKIDKPKPEIERDIPDLKDAVAQETGNIIVGTSLVGSELSDETLMELVTKHFNAVTPGNELKMDAMFGYNDNNKTCPGIQEYDLNGQTVTMPVLDYSRANAILDTILEWNTNNPTEQIQVRGHVLVWHSQAPEWFFHKNFDASQPYVSKDEMNVRLEWYIKTVLEYYTGANSKYKDLFYGWDVVNEAISDNTGTYRTDTEPGSDSLTDATHGTKSSWWKVYQSNEFIINAFRFANKYAPSSLELYYNDYNECNDRKRAGIIALVEAVKAAEGTRIDGVGMQGHYNIDNPSASQIETSMREYIEAAGQVQLTELDVKASSSYDGTEATRASEYTKQAYYYKAIYDAVRKLRAENLNVGGFTIWGVIDKNSWLQSSNSVGGASNGGAHCPLLFDDNYKAKPSYWAFVNADTLEPDTKEVTLIQKQDETYSQGVSYSFGNDSTSVEFVPMWTNSGLSVKVNVTDSSVDATDCVTIYVDEANSKAEGANVTKVSVKRADAVATKDGYQAVVDVLLSSAAIAKKIGFDITVTNNEDIAVFNDLKKTQDTSSKYYAEATMKPYATIGYGTVTIDGEADAVWNDVTAIPLTITLGAEASATVKVLWDKSYLYVYADIKDAELDATGAETHEKDSLEVFIDENNAKTDGYEDDDKQYRVNYLNEQSYNGTKSNADNMLSKVKVVDGGYVVEAAYKWTDITPKADMEIGLEFQINDAKAGARIGTASWYDESGMGWSSPGVFGTVMLTGEADTPAGPSEGGSTTPGSGSSTGGSSSSDSSTDSDTSTDDNATSKDETKPEVTPDVPESVTPGTDEETEDNTPAEDITPTIPTLGNIIPEAVETVVEQLETLVDTDATYEEKVEAVQKVIDTVVEVIASEEVQELAKEAISSIEQKMKDALGIDTEVECEGEDVPEVKSVIGALLSVDAGKQPKLKMETLNKDEAPEMDELDEGLINGFPLNIKLTADDREIQPNVPITIRMSIPKGIERDKEIKVVHFGRHGKDMLDVELFGEDMEFTTDGFSTFIVVNVESATVETELVTADEVTENVADTDDTATSAIEEKTDDNGLAPFIIVVIVVAVLAMAVAGFFVIKSKKEE